ncbi:rad8 and Rdh54p [Fusarium subglutinans]|uniref:Rad8 and Rdh54p n=1 Tax=Gibberella subglutinans TaxID=42677 RepID=A0A8H5Q150_GIBSU|nr:rad8 and Rdh54p [Fusarium subglutinans]KAF5606885.1 rad8 and Rdh54p [Fusarium subglutinans]
MGRCKATARRSTAKAPHLHIGLDDLMPTSFVEGLISLMISENETSDQASSSQENGPPTKRRKTESPMTSNAIPIAKKEFTISRPCAGSSSKSQSFICKNVDRYINIDFKDNQLCMNSRKDCPSEPLDVLIRLRRAEEDDQMKISYVLDSISQRASQPNALWGTFDLELQWQGRQVKMAFCRNFYWNASPSPHSQYRSSLDRCSSQPFINFLLRGSRSTGTSYRPSTWSPMDFYEAAFVPRKDEKPPETIQVDALESTLFPYQKRTLQWLLRREGAQWSADMRRVIPYVPENQDSVYDFKKLTDVAGNEYYLSELFHTVTRDISLFRQAEASIKGGILAEEMGLGKTLEVLGLILLHQRSRPLIQSEYESQAELTPSGATLIVTPPSLKDQWASEIARHAPSLSVKVYEGRKRISEADEQQATDELAGHDIILTTYSVLSSELHFTITPPERSRRHARVYDRPKSPLVQISWWRICLDEAQMIESGYSQAAKVARVLPRINAWGITGTPVKNDVEDLQGLLLFLQYEPYCSVNQIWQDLIRHHKSVFQRLFNRIAIRHTKSLVRDELVLPSQKRFVISMPFTAVEEQHYQSLYREMAEACGLSLEGAPIVEDWKPEDHEEDMRTWLVRLRQTALHPEVAAYNRRTLGNSKNRPMRTVDEVLDAMLEQSESAIRSEERAYLSSKLTRGQLYENSPRVKEALEIWLSVREEARKLVSKARDELKSLAVSRTGPASHEDSDIDDDSGVEEKGQLFESRRRLRGALEMYHRAVFFCANAYFQIRENSEMTEPESEDFSRIKKLEDEHYEEAKAIRREILQEPHHKATRLMAKVAQKASEQSFVEIPELTVNEERGIESGRIVDDLEALCNELNDQANVIDEWREHLIGLVLKPLVDEEEEVETTGDEYGESAKIQDELMVYVQALRAIIADRQDALTGQTNELIKHETQTSLRLAANEEGPAPEKLIELLALRDQIKPRSTSMRKAISEFRGLTSKLARDTTRSILEGRIADRQLKATQAILNTQSKLITALEAEVDKFKNIMNLRLEYYRQLQVVSDSVLPYEEPVTEELMRRMKTNEENMRQRLSAAEAKHRYLLHLKEAGNKSNEPRMCVICQTNFIIGVLTVCGHQFCKECMMLWFNAHHNCPQLKVHSDDPSQSQDGTENSSEQKQTDSPKKTGIYSEFNSDKLAEIQKIELDGPSFTTKVDTLVKHLMWLRESDPGAKSIVFSQYKGFLGILRNAFSRFRIGYASIDDPDGIKRFKEDASVECFLLHARAHSSGLNLVNASHVFLCEPLLNTALELQAIARVDRIGQMHETTVWLYLVSGTVEESIYNLSVQRRMEHMGRVNKGKSKQSTPELLDVNIEAANTLELEQASLSRLMSKDKSAGEIVGKNDLWECLFGHIARKETEPEKDIRLQEKAVMGYLAAEAAEERMDRND